MNNYYFHQIVTPPPIELKPTELTKLAKGETTNNFLPPQLPPGIMVTYHNSPRSLDEIFENLEQDKVEKITLLEWVYCLYHKREWDQKQSKTRAVITANLIWQQAINNLSLRQRFCNLLAFYYCEQIQFAWSLSETFDNFSTYKEAKNDLIVKIIYYQKNKNFLEIAQEAQQLLLTPIELLNKVQLPRRLRKLLTAIYENIVISFTRKNDLNFQQVKWLLNCLNEMDVDQQIVAVETLLQNLTAELGGKSPELIEWLQHNYNSRATGSKWDKLSTRGKQVIRQWFCSANYFDFQTLVEIILKKLPLQDFEANQLKSRKYFWSNYSERFENIRILLPQSSLNVIGQQLRNNVDLIQDDGSNSTEVCIFDFGDWLIVEFFRGGGSETRIFNKMESPEIAREFFESQDLSVKRLRSMGGDIQDHQYFWQYYCEQILRRKGIFPNPSLTRFQINSNLSRRYDNKIGLPPPNDQQLQEREWKLIKWRQQMRL